MDHALHYECACRGLCRGNAAWAHLRRAVAFSAGGDGAGDSLNSTPLSADTSQQTFLPCDAALVRQPFFKAAAGDAKGLRPARWRAERLKSRRKKSPALGGAGVKGTGVGLSRLLTHLISFSSADCYERGGRVAAIVGVRVAPAHDEPRSGSNNSEGESINGCPQIQGAYT